MAKRKEKLNRREFLRVLGLSAGAATLAACAPAAPAAPPAQQAEATAAPAAPAATEAPAPTEVPAAATAAPAAGTPQEIVVAQYADVVSLDPQDTNDNASYGPEKLMFEGLLGFNAQMEMEPILAEKYEASDDATQFTFYLRQGVKFHDGTPFNAEAVKYNFDRVTNADNTLKRYGLYSIISKTEVVDEYTVKFTTSEPLAP